MTKANTSGFRMLPSYYEAIRDLPDDDRLKMYDAIADYGFGNAVSELPPILQGYLNLIIPTLARSIKFEEKQIANGKKGGRPPKPKDNGVKTPRKPSENLAVAVANDNAIAAESAVDKAEDKQPTSNAPTLAEVRAYCQMRNSPVDPEKFHEYYEVGGWMDSRGKFINWQQKLLGWESHEKASGVARSVSDIRRDDRYTYSEGESL